MLDRRMIRLSAITVAFLAFALAYAALREGWLALR
jgi:hypothetical protein